MTIADAPSNVAFVASRSDLMNRSPRVLSEAITVATGHNRHSVLLRVQNSGSRVIDCWLSNDGLCMHTRAADGEQSAGTYVPAELAEIHLASVLTRLFSPVMPSASDNDLLLDTSVLRRETPMPPSFHCLASAWRSTDQTTSRFIAAFGEAGNLVGQAEPGDTDVTMIPTSAAQIWATIRNVVVGT